MSAMVPASVPPGEPGHDGDPGSALIASFFGPKGVGSALAISGWTAEEEVRRLVEAARDPDPKVSIAAMRQLRSVIREVAETSGILVSESATLEQRDGSVVRRVSSSRHGLSSTMKAINEQGRSAVLPEVFSKVNEPR